ncbi:MAG: hypothetical protein DLM65_11275 [Candidatus Aeolococcus gillhamiae]|uniref:Uncharacterized protein n=1 Tax=Candidatus Aeolococcus gillhamiae TaxID=3127015 RepID=A0A2W5Z8Q3_9BACT|nr:MAG: hypothetical protein DLM65_11275 [Candidatus Dormibacter sp. RRmetagenome_bin12]
MSVNFWPPRLMPGDPISALDEPTASAYVRDDSTRILLERHYGLDRPLAAQFGHHLAGLAHGDLETSIRYRVAVSDLVRQRLPDAPPHGHGPWPSPGHWDWRCSST